jgi:membrane protease YdiL (CAAX protease family)
MLLSSGAALAGSNRSLRPNWVSMHAAVSTGWSLLAFFILTYALAWAGFLAAGTPTLGMPAGVRQLFFLPAVFAPGIVALWLAWRSGGRAGVSALLAGIGRWQVAARWYLFAAGYMAAVKLTAAVAHRVTFGDWPAFGDRAWVVLAFATLVSTPFQAGEEIGWRGFALPRLTARIGARGASVLLGAIWAAWHLPLFFIPGTSTTGQSFPLYLLQVTALSVAFAWLYWRTGGSLLLTMLLHAAVNNTKDIVPSFVEGATTVFAPSSSPVAWLTVALLWICAAYFLIRMPKAPTDVPGGTRPLADAGIASGRRI